MAAKTPDRQELWNKTPEPKEGMIVAAVIKAARRLTEKQLDAVLNGNLEKLWELMSAPPWIRPYIPHLLAELKKRLDAKPQISIEDAIADLDINFELEPGYVVVVDLNGYSNFQNQATDRQKAMLDKAYQQRMFELSDKFETNMLQAPAGDAFIFHIEADPAKLNAFLADLKNSKIKNPSKNPDPKLYPDGCFTFSTGAAKNHKGDLNMSLYTAAADIDHGLIDVGGTAFVNAVKLQKDVGRNQIGMDGETQDDLQHAKPFAPTQTQNRAKLPENEKEAIALMSALAKACHPRGSISTINRDLIEDLPNLGGISTIAIYAGDLEKIGEKPNAYRNISKKLLALRAEFPNFFMFKKDEAKFHVHTNTKLDEEGGKRIIEFCAKAAEIVASEGLTCGIGVGYTETMVRTRVLNSSLEERAGAGIVKAVRLATTPEKALHLDHELCKAAFGNIFELQFIPVDDIKAKGGDIACVTIPLDDINFNRLEGKTLVGVEDELAALDKFIDDGGALKISSPGSGFGVSALIRYAARRAKQHDIPVINLERDGNGPMALIRGILKNCGADDFESLLLNGDFWNRKQLLVLDQKNLSDEEKHLLDKLLAVLIGTNTRLVHSQDFDSKHSNEVVLEEFSPEKAADMILEINKGLNKDILRDPIISALAAIFAQEGRLPFTPRNILRNYSKAIEINKDMVTFNPDTLNQIQTGELTQRVKELDISEERILLLGIIAYINIPLNEENLWSIYSQNGHRERSGFTEDLQYLCERGFINFDGGEYSLKDRNQKDAAIALAQSQIEEARLSEAVLASGAFSSSIEGMEARLEHLLKADESGGTTNAGHDIETIIQTIGSQHFKNANLSAARAVYTKYLPFLDHSRNEDLKLEIAWAFHDGDTEQMKITEDICANSKSIKAKWILSRLAKVKIESNIGDELREKVKTDMTEDEMDECFNHGLLQDALRAISESIADDHSTDAILMKCELKIEDLYQRIKTYRFFRYEKKNQHPDWLQSKNAMLKTELENLIVELSDPKFENGNKEMMSAAKIAIASAYYELLERAKAKDAFREAAIAVDALKIPDYKQKIICILGEVFPWDFLLQHKIDEEKNPTAEWRRDIDAEIDEFEARIRFLEESCIHYGDTHYRTETYQIFADATELRMRAIAKFPMPKDDQFHGLARLEKARSNVERFIKTRIIIGNPPYPHWEQEAKQMLDGVFATLPDSAK